MRIACKYDLRMSRENRSARLTILIDPAKKEVPPQTVRRGDKKAVFEELCRLEDLTPSQVVRRLIRGHIELKLGRPWKPGEGQAAPKPPAHAKRRKA